MGIRAKTYANKSGKADGKDNRVQVTMDVNDAKSIADGDKEAKAELVKAIKGLFKK